MVSCKILSGGNEALLSMRSQRGTEGMGLPEQYSSYFQGWYEFDGRLVHNVRWNVRIAPTEEDLSELERQVFEFTNQERKKVGRRALLWDDSLARAARSHSQNMGNRDFFSHEDPRLGGLSQRLRRFRIPWGTCGENIWMGTSSEEDLSKIAREAVSDWMNSPGHRANILNTSFTHLGVGAYYDPQRGAYYMTQVFIRPPREQKRSWWQTFISRIFPRKFR